MISACKCEPKCRKLHGCGYVGSVSLSFWALTEKLIRDCSSLHDADVSVCHELVQSMPCYGLPHSIGPLGSARVVANAVFLAVAAWWQRCSSSLSPVPSILHQSELSAPPNAACCGVTSSHTGLAGILQHYAYRSDK